MAGECGDRSAGRAGEIVRAEREKRCLSQAKLAVLAEVSSATVSAVELGQRATSLDLVDRLLSAMGLRLHVEAEPRFADIDSVIAAATGLPPGQIMAEWVPDAAAYLAFLIQERVPFIVEGMAAAALQGAPVQVETLEIAVPAGDEEGLNRLSVMLAAIGVRRGNYEVADPRLPGSPDYVSMHGPLRLRMAEPFEPVFWIDIDPVPETRLPLLWFLRESREPLPRARIAVTPLAQVEASTGQVRRVLDRTRALMR